MKSRWSVMVAVCALSCSGAGASKKADDAARGDGTSISRGAVEASGIREGVRKVSFPSVKPKAVTYVGFRNGKLAVGHLDGVVSKVDVSSGSTSVSKASKAFQVAAVAPNGDLALLGTNPPVIVNLNGDLILQMNTVKEFESAVFTEQGMGLYVADRLGKVRIWGQAHSFEEDQHKEKLENYLNRQAPDFHVEFGPIRGPLALTDDGKLVVTDEEGVVNVWDPTKPSSSKRIMKLDGHARSVAAAEGFIYATSVNGALKIGKVAGGYLPWTHDARGGMVAAHGLATGMYWQLDTNEISARKTETGDPMWQTPLPDGNLCGLAISEDASHLAACVGNFIVLLDADGGAIFALGYRADDGFQWQKP